MNRNSIAYFLIGVVLCAGAAANDEQSITLHQTRAWIKGKCPVADAGVPEAAAAALLAALAPAVIDKSIDLVAGVLKAAGDDETSAPQLAATDGHFYMFDGAQLRQNAKLKCLVIARGDFSSTGKDDPLLDADMRTFVRAYSMAQRPEFLLEARFKFSNDGRYFRLEPVTVWYSKPITSSLFTRDVRSAAIAVSFYKPGTKEAFASSQLAFPEMSPPPRGALGTRYIGDVLRGSDSQWMPVFPDTDATLAEVTSAKNEYDQLTKTAQPVQRTPVRPSDADDAALAANRVELCRLAGSYNTTEAVCQIDLVDQRVKLSSQQSWIDAKNRSFEAAEKLKGRSLIAVNDLALFQLQVSVTETRTGSQLAKFLASVLDASKKDLAEEVKARLPQAKEAAKDDQEKLELAALNARTDVQKKELEIAATTEDSKRKALELELPALKYAANIAYRKAGKQIPYADISF